MNGRAFLIWLAAGAGVMLVYAAYKGDSPTQLLTSSYGLTNGQAQTDAATVHPAGNGRRVSNHKGHMADVPDGYHPSQSYVPGNVD